MHHFCRLRGFTLLLAVICVAALSAPTADAAGREEGPVKLESASISFAPFLPGIIQFDKLEWRGGIVISSDDDRFGGYSGLVFSDDGTKLVAVSDRGWWFSADVAYEDDRVVALDKAKSARLLGPGGKVIANNHARDAEGLTVYRGKGLDGWLLVALERRERMLLYNFGRHGFRASPKTINLPSAAKKAKFNQELEAVGRFGAGTQLAGSIIALSERFLDNDGNIRGWLIGGARAGAIAVRRSADYDITDLAILPDGDVLILERRFNAIKLAGMRLRRIAHADIKPGATLDAEILLEANQPLKSVDNMEGLAIHRSPGGELRLSIISDDNFNPLQRTLLLQFAFPAKPNEE
jgi:hypothetical protein